MSGGSDDDAALSWLSRFGSVGLERSRVFARVSFEKKNWKSLAESLNDFSVCCAMPVIRSETVLRDKLTLWNSLIFFWRAQLHSGNEAQIHLRHEVSASFSSLTTTKQA